MISSTFAYFLRYLPITNAWIIVLIGIGILIVSGLISIISKKNILLNVLCFTISAVALGFCIRAWYIFRGFDNSFLTIFLVSLACVAYLWIFYLLTYIPFVEKHFNLFFWLYFIISFIVYLILVFTTKTTYISTFGYYMIIEMSFIFALCSECENMKELIKSLTLSTYSVFVVAIFIILAMSDGSDFSIDGIEFIDINKQTPKKKKVDLK